MTKDEFGLTPQDYEEQRRRKMVLAMREYRPRYSSPVLFWILVVGLLFFAGLVLGSVI